MSYDWIVFFGGKMINLFNKKINIVKMAFHPVYLQREEKEGSLYVNTNYINCYTLKWSLVNNK